MSKISTVLCLWMSVFLVGCGSSVTSSPPNSQLGNKVWRNANSNNNASRGSEIPLAPPPGETPSEKDVSPEKRAKVNPWVDPAVDALSTFAIDVDTASYTYTRRLLRANRKPDPAGVRVEEFINFFDYKYEEPKVKGVPFRLHVDGAMSPYNPKHHLLRVGIQGRSMSASERKPMHITLLVDTSCSMRGSDRIELLKKSLFVLVDQMKKKDTIAIATYAGGSRKVLEPTDASNQSAIRSAIESLSTGGGTAMESGMVLAYSMASKSFVQGHENRVIVLSDGDANIGKTTHKDILATIESYVKKGITMTTVGFGVGNYRGGRMEQLANKGNGNSFYIDSEDEAVRVFRDKFIATMLTIAKDVKVQVEFNQDYVLKYRLIGYENRSIEDKDFRNDKVDAGELGAGHNVTALYEVELNTKKVETLTQSQSKTSLVTVRLRFKSPQAGVDDKAAEIVTPVTGVSLHRPISQTSWQLQWATAVAGFAEILRGSEYAKNWTLKQVKSVAQAARQSDKYHAEFISLVDTAMNLKK